MKKTFIIFEKYHYIIYIVIYIIILYPEWPKGKVVASHAEGCKVARSNPGCG